MRITHLMVRRMRRQTHQKLNKTKQSKSPALINYMTHPPTEAAVNLISQMGADILLIFEENKKAKFKLTTIACLDPTVASMNSRLWVAKIWLLILTERTKFRVHLNHRQTDGQTDKGTDKQPGSLQCGCNAQCYSTDLQLKVEPDSQDYWVDKQTLRWCFDARLLYTCD